YRTVRSYRVSARKIEQVLGLKPVVTVEESVRNMVAHIRRNNLTDFDHPRYYNIQWMRLLEEAQTIIGVTGTVWESPSAGWLAENPSVEQRTNY
ncbi:MAG: hypothetical protein NTZ05_08800, partial [Chloroflexi bacterium]|nr:hypothetical protein [Chloroflexota bacterium]